MKLLTFLFAMAAAYGQTPESRTFTFAHTPTPQTMQEVVNTIRSIGETQHVTTDQASRAITVAGTADQLAFATWVFTELDKPAAETKTLVVRDTTFADARSPAVKIFYPARISSPQSMQEAVNAIRSITEVQRVVAVTAANAIIARGSPERVALAEWMMRELDTAAGNGPREYTFPDDVRVLQARTPAVRIYFPKQLAAPLDLQEAINTLRSIAEVQRAAVFSAQRAIVIRGNDAQAALTDWLMKELDQAAPAAAAMHETPFADSMVRSVFLAKNADLAATLRRVREVTGIQRAVANQRPRAMILRGTPGQLALAEGLLR